MLDSKTACQHWFAISDSSEAIVWKSAAARRYWLLYWTSKVSSPASPNMQDSSLLLTQLRCLFPPPHLDRFYSSCFWSVLCSSRSSLILQDAGDFFSTGFQSIPSHFFCSARVYSSFASFYIFFYCDFMEESPSHRNQQLSMTCPISQCWTIPKIIPWKHINLT